MISDSGIRDYCRTHEQTLLGVGFFEGGELRAVSELRSTADATVGELSFSVEVAWRGQGIGGELARRAIECARNRGYKRLDIDVSAGNALMRRLAAKCGSAGVDGVCRVAVPSPDAFSVWTDAWDDAMGGTAFLAAAMMATQAAVGKVAAR
jgi:GNAT superfamily N-acetyltransferase